MSAVVSITISSIEKEQKVSTAGKPYERWVIYDTNGKKYTPFVAQWNESWGSRVGKEVTFSWKKNGKYFNMAPPESVADQGESQMSLPQQGGNLSAVMERFDQIDKKLQRIEEALVVMGAFGPSPK